MEPRPAKFQKNGLECDYPRSTTERNEGPTEGSEGVC